jgi:uncharacterized delta-60 repeat protein
MRHRVIAALAALSSLGLLVGVCNADAAGAPGSLDSTFGKGGIALTAEGKTGSGASDVIMQPNGDILVSADLGGDFGVLRYLPSGSLDTSFGTKGIAKASFGTGTATSVDALALAPGGKIVVVGAVAPSGESSEFGIARFKENGSLDTSFGSAGTVVTQADPGTSDEGAESVLVQPEGKIVVGGSGIAVSYHAETTTGALVRYNANGSLDTSFGSAGVVLGGGLENIFALGLDEAGQLFVLPEFAEFSPAGARLASVTAAPITASSHGGRDAFLATGQSVRVETVGVSKHVTDVQAQRYSASGTLDTTFSDTPFPYSSTAARDSASAVAIAPDGQVVVGGSQFYSTSVLGLALLNTNGSLDQAFGSGGAVTTTINGNESINALTVQPNGDIVAAGYSENNSTGEVYVVLARYLG